MENPDPWNGHLSWDEVTNTRRHYVVFEWREVLEQYLGKVLGEDEPLRFSIMVGQPLYGITNSGIQAASNLHQTLNVYLDATRLQAFDPFEMLTVGAQLEETQTQAAFLVHVDFSDHPDFDPSVFHWLRLEHVLCDLRANSPAHFSRLELIYKFRHNCRVVLSSRNYRLTLLEDTYAFLQGHLFF